MAATSQINQDEFRSHLRQADKFLAEGNFTEARSELAKAKKVDPHNPFIHAFIERINHFEAKANPSGAVGEETASAGDSAGRVEEAPDDGPSTATEDTLASPEMRQEVEEEFKRKYTDELRKAEERAEKLLSEERDKLEKNALRQRLENEREFERVKLQFDKEYQDRLSAEIRKTEVKLEGEYQSELARLDGDLRTKLHQQFQADLVEEKERLKNELRGVADQERHSAVEMEQALRAEFEKRLVDELKKCETELRLQMQELHRREEEKLKIVLTTEFEERMGYEREKLKEEYEKTKKKGDDLHKIEVSRTRQSQEELEKKLREEFNRKLLESVRKAESAYEEQAALRMKEEQESVRLKLEAEFRAELERERTTLKEEYEKLRGSLEQSSREEAARLKQQAEARVAEQIATARRQLEEDFERRSATIRNELESKFQAEFEARLHDEREKVRRDAEEKISAEKVRLESEYDVKVREQGEKLKSVRKELRGQMEAELLKRMESLAADYETKLDLLGVRLPETKAEQINYYRDAMVARYAKGSLDIEDAKKLLQLKELLNLTFDEHLTIEGEVRLKTYSDRIRKLIVAGSLDPADEVALGKLKEKYGILEEEAKALEHHLLASFGKLKMKGRILVADDDKLLLRTIEDLLTDAGYAVVTAEDIDAAVDQLRSTPFDLILSDIKFSDNEFEGFAFYKKVQAIPPYAAIPFIFMSALSDGVIVRSGIQLGVDDYLTKPIEPELLIAVIEGKLKRYRAMKFQ